VDEAFRTALGQLLFYGHMQFQTRIDRFAGPVARSEEARAGSGYREWACIDFVNAIRVASLMERERAVGR